MNNQQQQQATTFESGIPTVGSIVRMDCRGVKKKFVIQVWAAGRTRAQQALNLYANLDYLRPYFDVEPKEVFQR